MEVEDFIRIQRERKQQKEERDKAVSVVKTKQKVIN